MRTRYVRAGLLAIAAMTLAARSAAAQSEKVLINTDRKGVALQGYDPVAFFTDGKPVKGDSRYQVSYGGGVYHFASAEHRDTFQQEPARYEPQFGGFCAWAASRGYTAKVDIATGQLVSGRLIFNYSRDVQKKFNQDAEGNLAKADANWPRLVQEQGRRLEAE